MNVGGREVGVKGKCREKPSDEISKHTNSKIYFQTAKAKNREEKAR